MTPGRVVALVIAGLGAAFLLFMALALFLFLSETAFGAIVDGIVLIIGLSFGVLRFKEWLDKPSSGNK